MNLLALKPEIEAAAESLRYGGVVAFPTETVYGLGAKAEDARAVARVYQAKGRPQFNPLIVHLAQVEQMAPLTVGLSPLARQLAEKFWPGPLTLVVPKSAAVSDLVTAGSPYVAIRIPAHPVAQALLRRCGFPLVAPSANRFQQLSPTSAEAVRLSLGNEIDGVLDGGACPLGIESTIIGFLSGDQPQLLRPGALALEDIEGVVGPVTLLETESQTAPLSPGRLRRHYAPRTPLWTQDNAGFNKHQRLGLLSFSGAEQSLYPFQAVEVLSRNQDLAEAASRFYESLRRLDTLGLDAIWAPLFPESGLGRALNDRLRRASERE